MAEPDRIVATLAPSPARRVAAVIMLSVIGALVVYFSFASPPAAIGWRVFLLGLGIGALLLADRVRRTGDVRLELTDEVLRTADGEVICRLDDVTGIERGALAIKPSNGFVLVTRHRAPRRWVPGIWWRLGRRVGIGGVTQAAQGKMMADLIDMRLRGQKLPGS